MRVILLQKVPKLGQMGDQVLVKPGYGRNYLIPKKIAIRATPENIKLFEEHRSKKETLNLEKKAAAEVLAKKIAQLTNIFIIRSASEVGHLYGSVRSKDIAEVIEEKGFNLERSQIVIPHPIKVLGSHTIHIYLHPEVQVDVSIRVAPSMEQALAQAEEDEEQKQEQE